MMKKFLVVFLMLVSGYAMAQPANYVPYASRNRYIALMADSTFHIPRFNGAPSLRTGGSTNDGALAADTANNRLYIYNGGSWTVVNKDTSNTFLNSLYKKSGTDSVFQIKGGTHTFAFTVGGSGSGGGITSLGTSDYGLITQNDSTYKVDTALLSTKLWRQKGIDSVQGNVNLKLNITDTANIKPRLYAGSNITITGTYPNLTIAASGGGGGSPAGNYGNVQLNRNGAFDTPGSDSLDFDAGLYIKGVLSASALPTGGVDADSVVVINSSGAFKKRNVSAFARMNTTSAANQLALFNGVGTLYSSSKFVFADASYPYMGMVGSDPLFYFGAISVNNPIIGSGAGLSLYGGDTYESINFYDKINSGTMMARFYNSGGTISNLLNGLIISNTLSSPSNYQGSYTIQRTVPYAVTGLNYHGFTDQTDFRVGTNSFNSFGSFVTIGNNRTSQGHFAAFQSVWYKDSTNRLQAIYDFVSAVSEMRAGTIDTLYRFKVFEATKTGGTIVKQYGIQIDNLSNATTNVGAWIYNNVGIGPTAHTPSERLTVDGNILGTGTIKTADPGSGAGAWKFGQFHSASGLILDSAGYIEVNIGGTVYWLALAATPFPKPNPKP
jgi:hypothetical protein